MKTKIVVLLLMLSVIKQVQACDVCTVFAGINPHDYKSWLTIRYRQTVFSQTLNGSLSAMNVLPYQLPSGRVMHNLTPSTVETTQTFEYREIYNTLELAGNFYVSPKWQLFTQWKMSDNYIKYDDSVAVNISGVGDWLLMANYQVFSTKTKSCRPDSVLPGFKHRLRIGGGVILPVGNYRKYTIVGYETAFTPSGIVTEPLQALDYELQPGAGSVSFPLNMNYLAKWRNAGVNAMVNYVANTVNPLGYRFANRFTGMLNIMYFAGNKNLQIVPFAGVRYDTAAKNRLKNRPLEGTGGEVFQISQGLQVYAGNIAVSAMCAVPVFQNLWGNQPEQQISTTISVKYFINK